MSYTVKLLENEVSEVLSNSKKFEFPDIKLYLHGEDFDMPITYPIFLDINKNYNSNLFSEITVEFGIGMGDYVNYIFKNRDNLEMTIQIDYPEFSDIKRYSFIPLNVDKKSDTTRYSHMDGEDLNKMDMVTVKGQCVDPIVLIYKQLFVSGIYKNVNVEKVIKGLFSKNFKDIKIAGRSIDFAIDMRKPDNDRTYDHIIIKSNTKLAKLLHYLQDYDYGVYNGGINHFIEQIKENTYRIYIYPLFNYELFDTLLEDKIIFYNSRIVSADLNDVSFWKEPNTRLYKLVTSSIEIENRGSMNLIEHGNALKVTYPIAAISKDMTLVNDKQIMFDVYGCNEIKLLGVKSNNIINPIYTNFDDNLFKYRSNIIRNNLLNAKLKLNMVDTRFIRPGMLVKYIHQRGDEVVERRGVLQSLYESYNFIKKENAILLNFMIERK